jgi:hypothetical protein
MIDPRRQNDQIIFHQPDPHPLVLLAADIKEALSVEDVTDLLVLMEMLVEKHLDLLLIHVAHFLGRNGDLIAILVRSVVGDGVDRGYGWAAVVKDTEGGEVGRVDGAAGVMVEALVTLRRMSVGRDVGKGSGLTGSLSYQ